MEINYVKNINTTQLKYIEDGEVFCLANSVNDIQPNIYMRIFCPTFMSTEGMINAVNLQNGQFTYFVENINIIKLPDANITISL